MKAGLEDANLEVKVASDSRSFPGVRASNLDDGHISTTEICSSPSSGARDSKWQDQELFTTPTLKSPDITSGTDTAAGEADSSVSKPAKDPILTASHVRSSPVKERSTPTVADVSCHVKEEGVAGATIKKSKLRSSASNKKAVKSNAAEHPSLTPDLAVYLEPLIKLEGVASKIKSIKTWHDEWTLHCNITKIAEGSFGSVFRMSDKEDLQEATIGKLIPLRPKTGKGSRNTGFTYPTDAVNEIRLLETMSQVPGFVEFRGAEVLVGALPRCLKQEYLTYKATCKSKKGSFCETVYPKNQMWLFIEMGDAGTELEDELSPESETKTLAEGDEYGQGSVSLQDVRDIFWGVAEALANGEEAQEFEHRDLHFSNICIQRKPDIVDGGFSLIPLRANIEVTLIDYSLSRATLQDGQILCNDMNDEEIFQGEDDLQFDVYRWMREKMHGQDLQSKNWEAFVPMTNVLWLYHLLEKLMLRIVRPREHADAKALWGSLNDLKAQIHPKSKRRRCFISAADVVSYAQASCASMERLKQHDDKVAFDTFSKPESSAVIDLSARFESVRIR